MYVISVILSQKHRCSKIMFVYPNVSLD